MRQSTNSPAHFLCPILGKVMKSPVLAMDGYTYERDAIEAWLRRSDISPITGLFIAETLVPNMTLAAQIAELELAGTKTHKHRLALPNNVETTPPQKHAAAAAINSREPLGPMQVARSIFPPGVGDAKTDGVLREMQLYREAPPSRSPRKTKV